MITRCLNAMPHLPAAFPLPLQMKYRLFTLQEPLMRLEWVGDLVAPVEPNTKNPSGCGQKPSANS